MTNWDAQVLAEVDQSWVQARRAALVERLDAGLAGSCEACGDAIPRERLDAVLTATRCIQCADPGAVDTRWCR